MDQLGQAEPQPCRLFWNAWQLSDWAITPASLQSKQSKARPHGTDEKTEKSRLVELELGREPLRVLRLQLRPRLRSKPSLSAVRWCTCRPINHCTRQESRLTGPMGGAESLLLTGSNGPPSLQSNVSGDFTRGHVFTCTRRGFPKLPWVHLHPEKIRNWAPERNSATLTCRTSAAISSAIQSVEIDAVLELKVTIGREKSARKCHSKSTSQSRVFLFREPGDTAQSL